ncbi:MAG: DUF4332 domain-containing protein [Anaerolineales bacterium]|nr:DUF4332 domain-containing protein [Anaerolineales bacterium]
MLALKVLAEGAEGPNTELLWILYIGLAIFVLAILLGWWSASRKPEQVEVMVEAEESKPKRKKVADDLVKIEGIGPKTVKLLNRAGIETFEDLAQAKAADVQKLLDGAGLQMMNPEGWIDQAKLAAKGDWDGFEKLQRELKGGRRKK